MLARKVNGAHPPRPGERPLANRRSQPAASPISLRETLLAGGLDPDLADLLDNIPHKLVQVEPRRPFREPGAPRDEVMFVRSGILAKFKADSSGGRQIVALRFAGEGILPRPGPAAYGIQAIVRSEVMVGRNEDFEPLVRERPELEAFFVRLMQRNELIGYEWLVNCGRRDSIGRVAHLLCETAVRMHIDNRHMLNPFTQQQIADITGQTSVNVNRVMADMERQGLIRRKGREIEFPDWTEMYRVASFQPDYLQM